MDNDEYVYIDCFYYGFYIKKSELKKYSINSKNSKKKLNNCSDVFNYSKLSEQLNYLKNKIIYRLKYLKSILVNNDTLITH